jgi:hypothetical protein
MNKKLMISIVLLSSCAGLFATTYQELRADLKNKLYRCQKRVLNEEQYSDFIEPYLQEGERVWEIPHYCREHSDSELMKEYFDCLVNYNIATFSQYVDRSGPYKKIIKEAKKKLMACIQKIKDAWGLTELDVKDECKRTTDLLHRASAQYYKDLSFKYKTLCFVEKVRRLF